LPEGRTEVAGGDGSAAWGDDSGRQSHTSLGGGVSSRSGSRVLSARSRPGSTRGGRPGSAMKKYRRGLEHKDHSGGKAAGGEVGTSSGS